MNILVLNGHKFYPYAQGLLNKTLFEEIVKMLSPSNEIKTTIVEQGYKVEEEIEKFKWADLVIIQSPVNWFSIPWILKKYFDEIYAYGVFYTGSEKYGKGGLFTDKKYMFSLTWNASETDFEEEDGFFEGQTPDDILINLHKMQEFCGFKKIETFAAYDVIHNTNVPKYIENLHNHLNKYVINL